jgi:UDP-N-acetylglucosamine acyltransferase
VSSQIHPTAFVSPQARLGNDVVVGPFCLIEDDVEVGDGCRLEARATLKSGTILGPENRVGDGAVLGAPPQHLRASEPFGTVRIGAGNLIREHVTIHRAVKAGTETRIGDRCLVMVGAHVAHDCVVGNQVILANNVLLAGHTTVGDFAYLSGAVAVHQFCRIGSQAMVGGQAHICRDVPPFVTVDGLSSLVVGLNLVGLKRRGFTEPQIADLKAAYRVMYRQGLVWREILAALAAGFSSGPAAELLPFLQASTRGILNDRRPPRGAVVRLATADDDSVAPAADDSSRSRKVG